MTEEYVQWQRKGLEQVKLTDRERELAQLMIMGLSNREIAGVLHLAEGTARNYISNLYGKLDVVDRAQAIIRLMPLISSPLKSPRLRSK